MTKISVGEAAIRLLAAYGVDTVFGIPGVHTLEFYRGLGDGSPVHHVQARNELGAGFMADGYARASGKPGVCLTISGPGVTNAATALGQAYSDSLPLLLLSAECATHTRGKGRGTLHEVTDLNAVTRPLTAFSECAQTPEDVPRLIAAAFECFASKRPRPVHIAVPIDVLAMMVDADWVAEETGPRPVPDPAQLEETANRLQAAAQPVILVGGGAIGADVTTLAERTGAIVIASNAGKGIVADSHPLSLGSAICRPEAQALLAEADLVLAIGTELGETDTYVEKLHIPCPLIRIDIDPVQMTNLYPAEVEIVADAKLAVGGLLPLLPKTGPALEERHAAVAAVRKDIGEHFAGSEFKHAILHRKLREVLPEHGLIMSDATQMTYSGSFMMPMDHPRKWHYAAGYCALGFAFPNAIGAKLANPDLPVVAIAGDGGTMFTVQELITAAEQKLPIPLLLWHNDGYKQIRDDMRGSNVPRVAVDGIAPDFLALAKAMHCNALEPHSLEEFGDAIASAFSADRPTVILVREDCSWLGDAL